MATSIALITFGALVLIAQFLEWYNFGNWNSVSPRYVFEYFELRPVPHISMTSTLWDLPLSMILFVVGFIFSVIGVIFSTLRGDTEGRASH
jgi:hypothetical protein